MVTSSTKFAVKFVKLSVSFTFTDTSVGVIGERNKVVWNSTSDELSTLKVTTLSIIKVIFIDNIFAIALRIECRNNR